MMAFMTLRFAIVILSGDVVLHNVQSASALLFPPRSSSSSRQQWGSSRFVGHSNLPRHTPVLYATPDDDETENDSSESQSSGDDPMADLDLDQQKLTLENMLKSSTGASDESSITKKSILTTARKQRLEREIELLERLDPGHPENNREYSDLQNQELVVSELWSLWYGERGPMNERTLRAIEETLGDPDLWTQAEKQYLSLIDEHCGAGGDDGRIDLSNWVEPANRLATLLYLMGRFGESKKWCERILSVKPWHIGALSGIVMVCIKMGDKEGVLKYSLMGLPNLSSQMRNARSTWVQKNVKFAQTNLLRLEELNRKAYGEPDDSSVNYAENDSSNGNPTADTAQIKDETDEDNSAWQ